MAGVIPRPQLPVNYRIQTANARKARVSRLPRWMRNPATMKRITELYQDYLNRMTLPMLQEKYGISVSQIYDDIHRAEEVSTWMFLDDIHNTLFTQIRKREQLIIDARKSLDRLRSALIVKSEADRARAEMDILRTIAQQESAIEELTGLRGKDGPALPGNSGNTPSNATITIDVSGDVVDGEVSEAS